MGVPPKKKNKFWRRNGVLLMTIENLLETLRDLEVKLEVKGDKLKVSHCHLVLPDDVRHAIIELKPALIEILASRPQHRPDADAATEADAAAAADQDPRPQHGSPRQYV